MPVETRSGSELSNENEILVELIFSYLVVFGNGPLREGAVDGGGNQISLYEYLSLVSAAGLCTQVDTDSFSQQKALRQIASLSLEQRFTLYEDVSTLTGYRPYYALDNAMDRFTNDLRVSGSSMPFVIYWGDQDHPVSGFATGVVVGNQERLTELLQNMPYLAGFEGDLSLVSSDLIKKCSVDFPILLDHEAGVLPEKSGTTNGSLWRKVLLEHRLKGRELGARSSLTVTFPESPYYKASKKRGEFIAEVDFFVGENKFVMVMVDLDRAISDLS